MNSINILPALYAMVFFLGVLLIMALVVKHKACLPNRLRKKLIQQLEISNLNKLEKDASQLQTDKNGFQYIAISLHLGMHLDLLTLAIPKEVSKYIHSESLDIDAQLRKLHEAGYAYSVYCTSESISTPVSWIFYSTSASGQPPEVYNNQAFLRIYSPAVAKQMKARGIPICKVGEEFPEIAPLPQTT